MVWCNKRNFPTGHILEWEQMIDTDLVLLDMDILKEQKRRENYTKNYNQERRKTGKGNYDDVVEPGML